ELLEGTFLQRLFELIEVIPQARTTAVERIENTQRSVKNRYDQQLRPVDDLQKGYK
ncbi:13571_t:CDS:1, partial [Gigaspora rosea]